jgi:hypothetical protein
MRFAKVGHAGRYEAIAAHPLEALDDGDGDLLPPIKASQLDGCPACPYCGNPAACQCSPCGALFCVNPNQKGPVSCPGCNEQLTGGGPARDFDIKRSQG